MGNREGKMSDYAALYKSIMFWRAEYIKRKLAFERHAEVAAMKDSFQTVLEYIREVVADEELMPIMNPIIRYDMNCYNRASVASALDYEDAYDVVFMNGDGKCTFSSATYVLFRKKVDEQEKKDLAVHCDFSITRKMQLDAYLADRDPIAENDERKSNFDHFIEKNDLLPREKFPERVISAICKMNEYSEIYGYYICDIIFPKSMGDIIQELLWAHNNGIDIKSKSSRRRIFVDLDETWDGRILPELHEAIDCPPRPFPYIHHQFYCKERMETIHVNGKSEPAVRNCFQGHVRADTVFAIDSRDGESIDNVLKEIERIIKIKNFLHQSGLSARAVSASPLDAIHFSMPEGLKKVFVESLECELDIVAYKLDGDMGRALGLWLWDYIRKECVDIKTARNAIRKSKFWRAYVDYRDGCSKNTSKKRKNSNDDNMESENASLDRFYKSAQLCIGKGGIVPRTGRV